MKKVLLLSLLPMFLVACGSTSNDGSASNGGGAGQAKTPEAYCRYVGGEVKTVGKGNESFCLLPDGDVVKLQEFYDNNH